MPVTVQQDLSIAKVLVESSRLGNGEVQLIRTYGAWENCQTSEDEDQGKIYLTFFTHHGGLSSGQSMYFLNDFYQMQDFRKY